MESRQPQRHSGYRVEEESGLGFLCPRKHSRKLRTSHLQFCYMQLQKSTINCNLHVSKSKKVLNFPGWPV